MARRSELVIHESGLAFRFLYDKADPSQLHIIRRWGVQPDDAIAAYFAGAASTTWIAGKRCYETASSTHVLVWLWEQPNVRLLVITCVPLHLSHRSPQ